MVAYSSPLMPACAAHWLRAIPQKRTPARETTPGLRSRRLRMGGSYPAALVTGTATLLRLCLLAPLLPEKCELLHIGTLFSSSLCTGRCTEVGDDGSPERQRRAAVGSGASVSGPCSPKILGGETLQRQVSRFPLSSSCKAIGRWSCSCLLYTSPSPRDRG